jgi:hypothetical protein
VKLISTGNESGLYSLKRLLIARIKTVKFLKIMGSFQSHPPEVVTENGLTLDPPVCRDSPVLFKFRLP